MDTANVRKRLPPLATTATKLAESTVLTRGISKTVARSTSFVTQKTIHNFVWSKISSKTHTDQFKSETLKRVESILSGPNSGVFFRLWIFLWVVLENWSLIPLILIYYLFVLYINKKFSCKKIYFATLVLLGRHVKSKANQLKIFTIYNLSIIKY